MLNLSLVNNSQTGKFNIDKRKKTKLNTAKINSKDIKVNSTLVVAGWGANYVSMHTFIFPFSPLD